MGKFVDLFLLLIFFLFFARFLSGGLTFHQHFAATWKTITFAVFYCYSQLFLSSSFKFFSHSISTLFPCCCSLLPQDVIMMISNRLVRIISFFLLWLITRWFIFVMIKRWLIFLDSTIFIKQFQSQLFLYSLILYFPHFTI